MNHLFCKDALVAYISSFLSPTAKRIFSIALCKKNRQGNLSIDDITNEDLLLWAFQNNVCKHRLCDLFVEKGQLNLFKIAVESHCPFLPHICEKAAAKGFIHILKYLHSIGQPWTYCVGNEAAGNGHIDCLRYLHHTGYQLIPWNMVHAIRGGHISCIKYLYNNRIRYSGDYLDTIKFGHFDCLKYFYERTKHEIGPEIGEVCIINGNLICFQYIYKMMLDSAITVYKRMYDTFLDSHALKHKFITNEIKNSFYNIIEKYCYIAIEYNQLECLQFMHNSGHVLTTEMCNAAAKLGKLRILKYMKSFITTGTSYIVAQNGYINCLKFLHRSGLINNTSLLHILVSIVEKNGHSKCQRFLQNLLHDSKDSKDNISESSESDIDDIPHYIQQCREPSHDSLHDINAYFIEDNRLHEHTSRYSDYYNYYNPT